MNTSPPVPATHESRARPVVILIDTGPIVAAASKRDQHHATCLAALSSLREPPLITPLVVMEVCYFLSTRASPAAEAAFLRSIAVGSFDLVSLTTDDLERAASLIENYANLPLGANARTEIYR